LLVGTRGDGLAEGKVTRLLGKPLSDTAQLFAASPFKSVVACHTYTVGRYFDVGCPASLDSQMGNQEAVQPFQQPAVLRQAVTRGDKNAPDCPWIFPNFEDSTVCRHVL